MKTAMELALARIELMNDINHDSLHWEMFKNDCMEKEKEQIRKSFIRGDKNRNKYFKTINSEEYYNETYKNK